MKGFTILLCFLFLFTACGRKAPPLPVEKSIPDDPQLEIEATSLGFNLWINLPSETKGGYPLNKIKALIIEREEISVKQSSKPRLKHYTLKPKLHSAGRLLLFSDTDLKAGFHYKYSLKLEKDFLVKTPFISERVVSWTTPPSFPMNVKVELTNEGRLRLTWDPPLHDLQNQPLAGDIFFRIERHALGKVTLYETRERFFLDEKPEEIGICYRLQTVLNYFGTLIPSPKSGPVCYP
ncbi:MAG: hypothetical protein N2Z40_04940 [Caldimicrobium sp.]|nr:hypothetical protein [Caldimicrobium sp.]MCX7613547.1 hypothetical protein [Caldimicrobium sp.]MDW8182249.1 hypothetical protein [Caldimicrobium sp.]